MEFSLKKESFFARIAQALGKSSPPSLPPRSPLPPPKAPLIDLFRFHLSRAGASIHSGLEPVTRLTENKKVVYVPHALISPQPHFFTWENQRPLADASLVVAEGAAAASGTLLLPFHSLHSPSLTLFPPIQIVILPLHRLKHRLSDLLSSSPSNALLLSGPSFTRDIEGRPIFGYHGPRELHILLVESQRS